MILSAHAVFGAAVASLVPNHPVAGFTLGFVSHFVLDAIPHRDYELISVNYDLDGRMKPLIPIEIISKKFKFIRDIILISFDTLIGLVLAFLLFFDQIHPRIFLVGAIAGLAPDFLTFLYLILKHKSLTLFSDFHSGLIHSKIILRLSQPVGVLVQFCTVAVLIGILSIAKYLYFL